MNQQTLKRFWAKVKKTDTCWLWTASKRAKGYGAFVWALPSGEIVQGRAHRFSFELLNGPIPQGMCILHRCDTPACVNPDHLYLGTKAENNEDMRRKGRHVPGGTHCGKNGKWPKAEGHHNARLTWPIVATIREDRSAGLSFSAIAKKHGITISSSYKICKNLSWKN